MFAHKKNYGCVGYVDDPLPNIIYIAPACIVWLYYEFPCILWLSYILHQYYVVFSGQLFFFCLVYRLAWKKKNLRI